MEVGVKFTAAVTPGFKALLAPVWSPGVTRNRPSGHQGVAVAEAITTADGEAAPAGRRGQPRKSVSLEKLVWKRFQSERQ